jgi:hypothetical protein
MLERLVKQQLATQLGDYPAVTLIGPRQCGKTTLARSFGTQYYDLEHEADIARLEAKWDSVVAAEELVIFDEAQNWPPLFNRLRVAIDGDRSRNGRFLLLGSVSPALMKNVSESLAGRLSLVELTPFLLSEVGSARADELWLYGGFPDGGVLNPSKYPRWQKNYADNLVERDLPNWGLPSKPQTTSRFFRMIAAVHGQAWNAHQIGESMGLNHVTVNSYLDYLAGAFLIRRLEPYFANIGKRLVKTPKVFWRDTGLLHALLNVPNEDALFAQPWVGSSWEGFVIEQTLATLAAAGKNFTPYFFRTSDQYEIDLVLDFGVELWAVEIKLAGMPSNSELLRLGRAADLIKAKRRFLVSRSKEIISAGDMTACNLPEFLRLLVQ